MRRGGFRIDSGIALGLSAPYCKYSILNAAGEREGTFSSLFVSNEGGEMQKIVPGKINAIRCLFCGGVVQSVSRHDFQYCPCRKSFVDGGLEYQRIGGEDLRMIEILIPKVKPVEEVFEDGGGI